MLKDLFKKEEKEPTKEEKDQDLKQKFLIYFIIAIVCASILSINPGENKTTNKNNEKKEETITIKKEDIINKLDLVKDNYKLEIYKTVNDEEKEDKLEISREKDFTIFYGSSLNNEGYVEYKGKQYIIKDEDFVLDKNNTVKNDIPQYVYNIDLLKKIINYCEFIDNNTCEINVSNYLTEYNNIYKTTYSIEEDKKIQITIEYGSKKINQISYDFSEIEKIINKKQDKVIYKIYINEINTNNFENEIKYFEELSKKKN